MGKVYLITNGDYYKIGRTKGDVKKRLKQLQTGSPTTIELVAEYQSNNYIKIESWFHRQYKNSRLEGEWFDLLPDEIDGFLNEARKIDRNINNLRDNPFF